MSSRPRITSALVGLITLVVRLLPARPDGYYREYTVPTPGEGTRGARRFVTGRGGELFYTADHYRSCTAVDPNR